MTPPVRKILVANRGEIAARVFRTCREHGIATVAVFSEADRGAVHVSMADEAVCIGPAPSAESYLRIDRILEAARKTDADAIHPGYGFLSENPAFARACAEANVTFIGPPPEAMEVMGDKVRSRRAMEAAGVPVVPGRDDVTTVSEAEAAAAEIGFPVMLKASAGGGGKGMRIVERPQDVAAAFEAASREAEAAFGDGRVFLERAVLRARHVEIQVMADAHGCVLHLGERDCSVQRRHQKVIEESPSPSPQMDARVRAAMGEVATRAAAAVDYRGAGTVEFLFEETEDGPKFYFLEMNTRLQVEHPVTEAVYGRDLVWDQIRVAAGEPLGYGQGEIAPTGHAIECRIYAEDPTRFLPSPGTIRTLAWPEGPGVRIDAAVGEGSEVSRFYDPMIAKIVAWGPTRGIALDRMRRALRETTILGIETNIPFHLQVLDDPDFRAGNFTTRFIDEHPELLAPTLPPVPSEAIAAAVAAVAAGRARSPLVPATAPTTGRRWGRAVAWRGR